MPNRRIYYPIQSLGFAKVGTTSFLAAHGVQSAGINTNITIEAVYELGQISIYDNVEATPEVEMTAEKVLDGYPLLWHLATNGSPSATLAARANVATTPAMNFFSDAQEAASGNPLSQVLMSGMVASQVSYTIPTEGSVTESITFIGSEKLWTANPTGPTSYSGMFNNQDVPIALTTGSGGVQNRKDVVFGPIGNMSQEIGPPVLDVNGQLRMFYTILPTEVRGISASGTNDKVAGDFLAHVQSISVSATLNRESLFELGRRVAFFRYANFPLEVSTEIVILNLDGDFFSVTDAGTQTGIYVGNNTKNQSIRIRMREGTFIDCGTKNRLNSVNTSGGDTSGGVSTITYSYKNSNDLTITHPRDPSNLPWPY